MVKHFVLSYFAGCGGFSLGAKFAGCYTLGVKYDDAIANLYRANVGNCITADVTTLDPSKLEIPGVSDRKQSGQILIWQLSPECKKFSRANTAAKTDPQNAMVTDSATSISKLWWHEQIFQPDVIILENVEDYAEYEGYQNFCEYLLEKGYRVLQAVLNAADFGVPQTRRRLIMIATQVHMPIPQITTTHSETMGGQLDLFGGVKMSWIGWHEAIHDLLPFMSPSELTSKQSEATTISGHRKLLVERIGYYKLPKVASAIDPCWTLRSHLADDGKGGSRTKIIDVVIGDDVRSLNTRAIARLQSFPDSYKWSGKMSLDVRAIGNAVPCLMAQRIVESVIGGL